MTFRKLWGWGLQTCGFQKSGAVAAASYADNVLALSPIAYWKLNETSGTTATDSSGNSYDGTYTGVALNQVDSPITGDRAGTWDGSTDLANLYSAGFASAFDGTLLTVSVWFKPTNWTANNQHVLTIRADDSNQLWIRIPTTNGDLEYWFEGSNVSDAVTYSTGSPGGWHHAAMTVTDAGDEMKAYFDGSQVGTTQTTIGTWAGSPASDSVNAGCYKSTPSLLFGGNIAHVSVFDKVLTAANITTLATAV